MTGSTPKDDNAIGVEVPADHEAEAPGAGMDPGIAPVELMTRRLCLWIPQSEHAAEVLEYHHANRRHLERWVPSARPLTDDHYTEKFWRRRLLRAERERSEGTAIRFVVSWRDIEPRPILGTAALTAIVRGPHQRCLLGYGLAESEQGKGIMTEALRALIDHGFGALRLHRIMANYMPSNARSGAVLKRLGFTVEGYARDYLFVNGRWRDHILSALCNPEPVTPTV